MREAWLLQRCLHAADHSSSACCRAMALDTIVLAHQGMLSSRKNDKHTPFSTWDFPSVISRVFKKGSRSETGFLWTV